MYTKFENHCFRHFWGGMGRGKQSILKENWSRNPCPEDLFCPVRSCCTWGTQSTGGTLDTSSHDLSFGSFFKLVLCLRRYNCPMPAAPTVCRKNMSHCPLQIWSDFAQAQTADQGQGRDWAEVLGYLSLSSPYSFRLCHTLPVYEVFDWWEK